MIDPAIGWFEIVEAKTAGNTMSTCVRQRYDPQYCLQSKLGSNTKKKTRYHQ
jgi:hypothetical protein